jgi:cytoskeletal protein CcmA (bactofilin family)
MARHLSKTAFTVGLLVLLMAVPALGASINKRIDIDAGEESEGAMSVNGSISVGDNAVVSGGLRTVNGSIRVDDGAEIETAKTVNGRVRVGEGVSAGDLATVNGAITIGRMAAIDGDVSAVNGSITVEQGSNVSGSIENVNGRISLEGSEVGGNIKTVMGDVELQQSVLRGDLVIEEPGGWGNRTQNNRKPRVVIGPGSRVEGTIVVEHEIELYISDEATVTAVSGVMGLDDAESFSGDRP